MIAVVMASVMNFTASAGNAYNSHVETAVYALNDSNAELMLASAK